MNFDWSNPYPSTRLPLFARNVVSTSQPLAAQAGLSMLQRGGNAVDAAIAAAAALTIVEPVSNGLGSDAFAIVCDNGGALHGLNASGTAPAAWSPDYFAHKYGKGEDGLARKPARGVDTVTVPGAVAAWSALHQRFGKLPFRDLIRPAIDLARRGHAVAPVVAMKWAAAVPLLRDLPGYAQTFMPRGHAPGLGERFVFEPAARALERIADSQGDDYYRGDIARAVTGYLRRHGGVQTEADFAGYQPVWEAPIGQAYAGHEMHELPPNGQGISALIALGILGRFDIAGLPLDGADAVHLQIEAMKLAFADTYRYVADPRGMQLSPSDLLAPAYLSERAAQVDMRRAGAPAYGRPPAGGTVYLAAADESGMMVSFIQSNFDGFGSGIVEPEWGISLQNRGVGFSMDPGSPNVVAGGKRPFHTIIPAFLTRVGKPVMAFGVMGGDMQPQGHVQTAIRMLSYRQQPQAACDAPRWKVNRDFSISLEPALASAIGDDLAKRGHRITPLRDSYMDFGAGQFIWRCSDDPEDGYLAASDPRRDGQAVGF